MADVIGISEFEAGTTARSAISTSGTAVIEASGQKKNSGYSLRIQPSASQAYQIWTIGKSNQGAPVALERTANTYFYVTFKFETLPPSATYVSFLSVLSNALGSVVQLQTNDSGALQAVGATTSSSAGTLKPWVWYTLRMRLLSNGSSEIQLNDGIGGSWRTAVTFTAGNNAQTYIVFGNNFANSTFLLRFGDWFVTSDGFVSSDVYFHISRLLPVADGNYTAWADTPDGASDYLTVDEGDDDGDTSYIRSATSGQASTFAMTPVASTEIKNCTILAVAAHVVVRDETAVSSVQVRLRSGSTDSDLSSNDPGSTYQARVAIHNTDPATSAAWTEAGVDGIEVGVELTANVAIRCTRVAALVLYTFTTTAFSGTVNERLEFDGTLLPSTLLQAAGPTLGVDPADPTSKAIYFSAAPQPLGSGLEVYGAYLPSGMTLREAVPSDWTIDTTPLVTRPATSWDDLVIEVPHYIQHGGVHRIYYGGTDGVYGVADASIGYMQWVTDHWERHGDPVLEGTESWELWGSAGFVAEPTVWVDAGGTWHMVYTAGLDGADTNIGHATSADGVTWGNKEMIATGNWHNEVRPYNGALFRYVTSMVFGGANSGIYEVVGSDISDPEVASFFQQVAGFLSHIGHHEGIHGPTVEDSDGARIMYFTGRDEHNNSIEHIFRAEIPLRSVLFGNQPAAGGTIAAKELVTAAGAQPAASASLRLLASLRLSGNQPAPSAEVASETEGAVGLNGNQPAATGALHLHAMLAVRGSQPAATGILGKDAAIRLSGLQPAPTGALSVQSDIVPEGTELRGVRDSTIALEGSRV